MASSYYILNSEIIEHFRQCRKLDSLALVWNLGLTFEDSMETGWFYLCPLFSITAEESLQENMVVRSSSNSLVTAFQQTRILYTQLGRAKAPKPTKPSKPFLPAEMGLI